MTLFVSSIIDVKIYVDEIQNTVIVKGEGDKKESAPCYNCKIDLPPDNLYKFDHIKAKMKNGDVFVPKIKDKERKDAINVKVEQNNHTCLFALSWHHLVSR